MGKLGRGRAHALTFQERHKPRLSHSHGRYRRGHERGGARALAQYARTTLGVDMSATIRDKRKFSGENSVTTRAESMGM